MNRRDLLKVVGLAVFAGTGQSLINPAARLHAIGITGVTVTAAGYNLARVALRFTGEEIEGFGQIKHAGVADHVQVGDIRLPFSVPVPCVMGGTLTVRFTLDSLDPKVTTDALRNERLAYWQSLVAEVRRCLGS